MGDAGGSLGLKVNALSPFESTRMLKERHVLVGLPLLL